ncbi:Sec-independent protein translocase subunit TatA [Williamsia deligens]|uniref:Sec-independent protein translocase protein TatA n=1 Tax=Williamsia deligens TaxID=321325 RepID=A0ABW3GAV4_9NOCA|nr:Sec-independent protein translocase subunit TatA [Williamsia deligens]MCP2195205.1 sec-independent protein translocase protein TatA [Williamsia deligens]
MGAIQPWHIIIVVIVFLILFGSKKLPDAARGLGRSMRIFKSEVKEMQNDGKKDDHAHADTEDTTPRQIPAPAPTDPTAHTTTEGERRSA